MGLIDWWTKLGVEKSRVIVIVSLKENLGFVGSWRDANQFFIIIDSWDGTEEIEKNESIKFKTKKSIILSQVDFDICLFGNVYSTIHSTRIQISYIYVKNMLVLKQAGTGVHVGAHMYAVCTPNPTPPQPKNLQTGF